MDSLSTEEDKIKLMKETGTWFVHNDWYINYCPYYHNKSDRCTAPKYVFDNCASCPKRWVNMPSKAKVKKPTTRCDKYNTDPFSCYDCQDKGTGVCKELLWPKEKKNIKPKHIRLSRKHKKSHSKLSDQRHSIRDFNKKFKETGTNDIDNDTENIYGRHTERKEDD